MLLLSDTNFPPGNQSLPSAANGCREPFPYQVENSTKLYEAYLANPRGALGVEPCGSGKTETQCLFLERVLQDAPSARILWLSRRTSIRDQNLDYALTYHPNLPVIKYSPKIKDFPEGSIISGTAQGMAKRLDLIRQAIGVIDECHEARRRETEEYGHAILPNLLGYVGLTATPFGLGSETPGESGCTVPIFGRKGSFFQAPSYTFTKAEALRHNRIVLATTAPIRPTREIDLKRLRINRVTGDYDPNFIEALDPDFIAILVKDIVHCLDVMPRLPSGHNVPFLDFCVSVDQCEAHSAAFAAAGLNVPAVNGSLSYKQRKALLAAIRSGEIAGVVSCKILDTGFDLPECGLVILSFSSLSRSRIEQIVGRAMRFYPGKIACAVFDTGGNSSRFGSFNWDYLEALEFDRKRIEKAKTERQIAVASGPRGPRNTMNEIRPDTWMDFKAGDFKISHYNAHDFVSRNDKHIVRCDLIVRSVAGGVSGNGRIGTVKQIFLGTAAYSGRMKGLIYAAIKAGRVEFRGRARDGLDVHELKALGREVFAPGIVVRLELERDDYRGWAIQPVAFIKKNGAPVYFDPLRQEEQEIEEYVAQQNEETEDHTQSDAEYDDEEAAIARYVAQQNEAQKEAPL